MLYIHMCYVKWYNHWFTRTFRAIFFTKIVEIFTIFEEQDYLHVFVS